MEPPPTPQPNIRIFLVTVEIEINPSSDCYVQGELQPNQQGAIVKAQFGLINYARVDGYAIVKLLDGEDVIISQRYFVPHLSDPQANFVLEATESLEASGLSCNIRSEVITVRLEVEPA